MRVCVIEPIGIPLSTIEAGLPGHEVTSFDSRGWSDEELLRACAGAEIIAVTYRPISAAVIEGLPQLKMIAVAFAGVDHVDPAAKARGIVVRNAAGYADTAVAELVLGFMLCLARDIPRHNSDIRDGGTASVGTELRGKTVGIVGTGAIGSRVSELTSAFGMTTLPFDRDSELPLSAVFAKSDFVTIHVPLTAGTRGMVSAELLAAMKPTAFLINCARGPIVNAEALRDALAAGELAGAALDVFDVEPPLPADYPLLSFSNVLATPHIGFDTSEALVDKGNLALAHIKEFIAAAPG